MKIIDSHLHIGNLSDTEFVTSEQVKNQLVGWGVTGGLVMPFAMRGGGDDWEVHMNLYQAALNIGFDIALYVNTDMVQQSDDLSFFLRFPFKALKIHPDAVDFSDHLLHHVCELALSLKLPLMIHTGADDSCHSCRFEPFVKQYPNVRFVLCHARPADEAFSIVKRFDNVWIDTAFLPFRDLKSNFTQEIEDRILFGTDYPANRWFPHLEEEDRWYKNQITNIIENFSLHTRMKLLFDNYSLLYN